MKGQAVPALVVTLVAASNLLDVRSPAPSLTLIMPAADVDGNLLSDGIELNISFGGDVPALTLSGSFRSNAPTSAMAGQVMRFIYSATTGSWWNN